MWWIALGTDDPDDCDDMGGRSHYAGMVLPTGHNANGIATVDGQELMFVLRTGNAQNSNWNGYGIGAPWGGRTLAHELGHNYNQRHTGCDTKVTNPGFPYDECWFSEGGASSHYGYDPISQAVIVPGANVGDLMSYNKLRWTSDFTWHQIWNHIKGYAQQSVLEQTAEPEAKASSLSDQLLVVSGRMDPSGGAEFYRLKILQRGLIPAEKQAAITLGLADRGGGYSIRQLDRSRRELSTHNFYAKTAMNQHEEYNMFAFAVPYEPGAKVIEITAGDVVLTSITATELSPRVTLLSPNGGETIGDTMTISWSAQDADSDYVFFDVQYSADNGQSWQLLAGDVLSTTVTVETDSIAGSDGLGLIRVVASDGINTSSDQSDRRFSVERHAPRPVITSPADGALVLTGAPLIVRGEAWDAEDGYLGDHALAWTHGGHGQLGSGSEAFVSGLDSGTHTFTLTATDSDRQSARATVRVIVRDETLVYLPMVTTIR